ncbi:MAG: Ig-like domain-containing protein [Marinifilaceae bacterium]
MIKKIIILVCTFIFILTSCDKDDEDKISAIKVSKIEITNKSINELTINEEVQLKLNITPTNATFKEILWTSSDKTIISVSNSGQIKAISKGEATITALAKEDNIKDTYTIKVKDPIVLAETIILNKESIGIKLGDKVELLANILPANTTDKSIKWISSNTKVASVNKDGLVTALAIGESTIKVFTKNSKSAICKLTIRRNIIEVERIEIEQGGEFSTNELFVIFKAKVFPENAENKTLNWSISDSSIGVILKENGTWKGRKSGSCNIIATASNGVKGICKLTFSYNKVTSISMQDINMPVNKEFNIIAEVLPNNASDNWVIAKVLSGPEGGLIKSNFSGKGGKDFKWIGKIPGEYLVEYTSTDKNATGTCKVTIINDVVNKSILIKPSDITIEMDQEYELNIECSPTDLCSKGLVWKMSDENIAFTDGEKTIIGNRVGTTSLTLKTKDGLTTSNTILIHVIDKNIKVDHIHSEISNLRMTVGESKTMNWTIIPKNATDKTVRWENIDPTIGSVDSNGKFLAKSKGSTIITAISNSDNKKQWNWLIEVVDADACMDPDGNIYDTVEINGLTWTTSNYMYLPNINADNDVSNDEARCYVIEYHGTDLEEAKKLYNYKTYGALYNYAAAVKYAPKGYRLPTNEEWIQAEIAMGMLEKEARTEGYLGRGDIANKFKSPDLWYPKGGSNESGLSLILTGYISRKGKSLDLNYSAQLWVGTEDKTLPDSYAYSRVFLSYDNKIINNTKNKKYGLAVRYVKK